MSTFGTCKWLKNKKFMLKNKEKFCTVYYLTQNLIIIIIELVLMYIVYFYKQMQVVLIMKFPLLSLLVDGRDTLELNTLQKIHLCAHWRPSQNIRAVIFSSSSLASSKRENCNVKMFAFNRKAGGRVRLHDNLQNGFLTKTQYRPIMYHKMQICIVNGMHKEERISCDDRATGNFFSIFFLCF